jgi:hypothetical protein
VSVPMVTGATPGIAYEAVGEAGNHAASGEPPIATGAADWLAHTDSAAWPRPSHVPIDR